MKKNFFILVLLFISCGVFSQKIISKPDSDLKNIPKSLTKTDAAKSTQTFVRCEISGTISGGNSAYLILVNERDDPFHSGIKIPIIDGHFEYDLQSNFPEKYTLILSEELENGAFRSIDFFAENAVVEFVLHTAQEFDKNTIKGGKLTAKMLAFKKEQKKVFDPIEKPFNSEIDSLWDSKKYFSEAMNLTLEKIEKIENGEERNKLYRIRDELLETNKGFTPRAWFVKNNMDSIQKIKFDWECRYIQSNQDVFSYSLLLNELRWYKQNKRNVDLDAVTKLVDIFSKKFPLHPYNKQTAAILEGIKMIKVGGLYIDFSAATIEGELVKASNVVSGKVALIDLWSSWCGPCRTISKSYIPVYEKYKGKGFVILGVANESKNTNAYKKAIEKDKYSWLNLVELDNKNRIWDKYNISNSGGLTLLIDSKGMILAIHPDAEQLEKILGELLK